MPIFLSFSLDGIVFLGYNTGSVKYGSRMITLVLLSPFFCSTQKLGLHSFALSPGWFSSGHFFVRGGGGCYCCLPAVYSRIHKKYNSGAEKFVCISN